METPNKPEKHILNADPKNHWDDAEHQGDWQLAESEAEDTAALLTGYQADAENTKLYATGDDPEDEKEDDEDEETAGDWGHTDPMDSPFPDSNDPSGPGSAV